MKHIYTLTLLLFTSFIGFGQAPAGYYDSATGTGYTLKTQLKEIINDVNNGLATEYIAVDNGYGALYTAYQTTDIDNFISPDYYENDGSVLDMYSESSSTTTVDDYNFNHSSSDQCGSYTGEGQCYNREHIFPQGFFNEQFPMRSDVHFVPPTDGYVNNKRSNFPFGIVTSPSWTSDNGSKVGPNTSSPDYTGNAFEPIDEFKGDIARMLLYFAVRYEDQVTSSSWDAHDAVPQNPLNGTNDQVYEDWYIDLLLAWHAADPVSPREIARNNASFAFQNNRNPFIDNPSWVEAIWNPMPDTTAPTAPTSLATSNPTDNTIDLSWAAATDDVAVVSYNIYVDGTNTFNTTNTTYTVTGLTADTNYCFTVTALDAAGNESVASNQACEMTTNNGSGGSGTTSELYISEYMEGSGFNKALEIANFTGATVSLANYTMKISTNGNATWNSTYNFPSGAQINDQDVYVIGYSDIAVCTSVVDNSNNTITGFNGNDVIGLFKDGVLIDILGTLGDGSDFAKNVTLIRNPNITSPNTTYTPSEWTQEASNTCDDLGMHNQILSITDITLNNQKIDIYPNPLNGDTLHISTNEAVEVSIFNILGKQVVKSNQTQIDMNNLADGIYIVRLATKNGVTTKKLIKN